MLEGTKGAHVRAAKAKGFSVHLFTDPYDALLATSEMPPEMIVVEITGGGLDFARLVAALRRRPATKTSQVFAIVSSATSAGESREAGADGAFVVADVAGFGAALGG